MIIHQESNIRVLQHEYLKYFYVQVLGEYDNPRTYGRHYDFYTVLQTCSIQEVNEKVNQLSRELP